MKVTFDYSGYAVLVTGGSNGIGFAIADAFAEAGASVTITGTRDDPAAYEKDLSAFTYHQLLAEDSASVENLISATSACDVLVNNAGAVVRPPDSYTLEGFDENIRINLNAVFQLSQGLRDRLCQRPGSIINIASMTSYIASPRVPAYGASKAAILQMTKTLAALYAGSGIRVNGIAPGWIETNLSETVRTTESVSQEIVERTPMSRWGIPDEISGTALYLASESLAGFVTGVTIPVDGGYSAC